MIVAGDFKMVQHSKWMGKFSGVEPTRKAR